MLTEAQREAYDRDGFIVVPDVFSPAEIDELRLVTDEFVAGAARVTANDDIYDLEDTHTKEAPHVRRLKAPHLIHPAYFRASRNAKVVEILDRSVGHGPLRHRQAQHEIGRLRRARSNGTRTGPSTRTPTTISPRSASCSTMSTWKTAR